MFYFFKLINVRGAVLSKAAPFFKRNPKEMGLIVGYIVLFLVLVGLPLWLVWELRRDRPGDGSR